MLITLFLILAAVAGSAYAYLQREGSPYAPSMHDYLDEESPESANDKTARAA